MWDLGYSGSSVLLGHIWLGFCSPLVYLQCRDRKGTLLRHCACSCLLVSLQDFSGLSLIWHRAMFVGIHLCSCCIYCSKPGFRWMHQLIGHAGICWWLDCWQAHIVSMDPSHASLKAFAASEPTLDELKIIANKIALKYIANHKLLQMCCKPQEQHDIQHENALIFNKYFLLYEELSYSMNHGDIGQVETSIVAWILILKATGKHKYATHMTNFLINMHFVFPASLKHAVRYHILVNPNGKAMKWWAVNWCVELNNLFKKVKNGGKGSNYTVEWIFLESPLV